MADADLIVRLVGNTDKLERSLSKTNRMMDKFSSQMSAIGTSIAGAFAAETVIQFGKEAVLLAAKAEGVRTAFNNLNTPNLLDNLQRATRGTVADLQLMQSAVQAKNFKIPLEQLGTFFQFATTRAMQTGQSVDYLVESIITGIGRKSPLILDNLGISAAELGEELKKTGDFGAAAGNIIRRSLEETGVVMDTTATKIGRLQSSFLNFKERAGGALINLGDLIINNLDKLPTEVKVSILALNGLINVLNDTEEAASGAMGPWKFEFPPPPITKKHVETLESLKNQLKDLEQQKLTSPISGIAQLNIQIEALKKKISELDKLGILSEVERKLLAISKIPAKIASGGIDFSGLIPPKSELQQTIDLFNKQKAALEGMTKAYDIQKVKVGELTATQKNLIAQMAAMQQTMVDFAATTIISFAEGLGAAISGTENFGDAFLKSIGNFLGQLGAQMIQLGIAKTALFEALKSGPIGGPALIVAGVALVAASRAISNSFSNASRNMGGGGSVGPSRTGVNTTVSRDRERFEFGGEFKVRGADLVLVLDKANYRKSITGG